MHPSIKQYKLKPNVTKKDLFKAGFKEGGWQKKFKDPKVSYYAILVDEIELHIEIETDTMEFNCIDNVLVLDADFCQPYTPFYGESKSKYLNDVIRNYNIIMDNLVHKDILEEI